MSSSLPLTAVYLMLAIFVFIFLSTTVTSFGITTNARNGFKVSNRLVMKVNNDAFTRANRATRSAAADDRIVEILLPLGMELAEDKEGNVFVKSIEPNGRAARTGKVFVGDYIAMASATFGEEMWSCRGVGLTRVLATIKSRNTKPVKLVLEAANEADEKKRKAIAFAELSEAEKLAKKKKDDELLSSMLNEDQALKKKGFRLW